MISPEEFKIISEEEGCKYFAYDDATGEIIKPGTRVQGKVTIGIGRNLTDEGITATECLMFLDDDWEKIDKELSGLPWFEKLGNARQFVVLDMAFQMGLNGMEQFETMIADLKKGDFDGAAAGMLASKWADETPSRAQFLAGVMKSGELSETTSSTVEKKLAAFAEADKSPETNADAIATHITMPTKGAGNTPKHRTHLIDPPAAVHAAPPEQEPWPVNAPA